MRSHTTPKASIIIILFPFFTFAQNIDKNRVVILKEADVTTRASIELFPSNLKPEASVTYYYYFKGAIHNAEGSYTGNLLDGPCETFYENDKLRSQGSFKEGLKNGNWKYWHKNGKIQMVENWRDGKKHGKFSEFDHYGNKQRIGQYKRNMLHGNIQFYSEGELQETVKYRMGRKLSGKNIQQNALSKDELIEGKNELINSSISAVDQNINNNFTNNNITEQIINKQQRFAEYNDTLLITVNLSALNSPEFESCINICKNQIYLLRKDPKGKYKIISITKDLLIKREIKLPNQLINAEIGNFWVSPDGKNIYLTASGVNKNNKLSIYKGEIFNYEIKNLSNALEKNSNFNFCHPFLTDDEKSMYFASDMPGSVGGMDIFISNRTENGWSQPANLGPKINTSENEIFPTLYRDSLLYFSSDRLNSSDGLDIFYSLKQNNSYSHPFFVKQLNSKGDDYYPVIPNSTSDTLYFISNRKGGFGKDDIYMAFKSSKTEKTDLNKPTLNINSNEVVGSTKDECINFEIKIEDILRQAIIKGAKVELFHDSLFSKLVNPIKESRNEKTLYCLKKGTKLYIKVSHKKYQSKTDSIFVPAANQQRIIEKIIKLSPVFSAKKTEPTFDSKTKQISSAKSADFLVVCGIFVQKENALKQISFFKEKGYLQAFVISSSTNNKHVAVVEAFEDKQQAISFAKKFEQVNALKTLIIKRNDL